MIRNKIYTIFTFFPLLLASCSKEKSLTDTAMAMAGLPPDKSLDGVNLVPYLTGAIKQPPHEKLCWRWISLIFTWMGFHIMG